MPKTKISEFSSTPASNTDIDSINIAEGCAPSGINDAIRELMAQLKDFQTGAVGDSFNGPVGTTTAAAGAFTTLSASSTLSVTGAGSIQGLTVGRGAGAVSTNTAVGASALATNSSGSSLTAVGANSLLSNTTGNWNTGVGIATLYSNTTGTVNSAVGQNAMYFNTTGAQNTGVGAGALYSNTTASNNTAVGYRAAYSNTTAEGNIALGMQALYSNTTGIQNTALGGVNTMYSNSTGSYNTGIGYGALLSNTTASNNTAVGYQAGYSNTTGGVTTLGRQAAYSNTTGVGNVSLGNSAGYSITTNSYNTHIGHFTGYNSTGGGNTFVGNAGSAGSVGCGYYMTTGNNNTIIGGFTGNQGGLDIRTASNYIVLSDGDGNPRGYWDGSQFWTFGANRRLRLADAYIGDNSTGGNNSGWAFGAGSILPADGAGVVTDNVLSLGSGSYRMATIYAGNGTINTSDANSKQDIENLSDAERRVAVCIKGLIKKFRFKDAVAQKGDDARIHVGVIAQEVQAAFAAEGLDASRYALFCSDTWYEVDGQGFDENKRAFTSDALGAVEKTRLGIRYDELLAFVIAAL